MHPNMQLLCKAIFRNRAHCFKHHVDGEKHLSPLNNPPDTLDHYPTLWQNGFFSPAGNWNFHIGYQYVARWSALITPERIDSPVKVIKSGVHAKADITEHINAAAGIHSWALLSLWAESAENCGCAHKQRGHMCILERKVPLTADLGMTGEEEGWLVSFHSKY